MCLQSLKTHPLFPIVTVKITCRICKFTFDLKLISALISTSKINKKQHNVTFMIFICIQNVDKHVDVEYFSWNSYPSPVTQVCLI